MSADSGNNISEVSPAIRILEIILALALLGSLFFAVWRVYRSLPATGPGQTDRTGAANSELTIVLLDGIGNGETKVELYPIDFAAIQRDFYENARRRKSFEDFLAERLKVLTPVHVSTRNGRGVARLSAGHWWMHATIALANSESFEWRVPVVISQRAHTIELSAANAYERSKKF